MATFRVQAGGVALLDGATSPKFDDREVAFDLQPVSSSWMDHRLVRPARRRARATAVPIATITAAAAWAPVAAAAPHGNQRRGLALQSQPLAGAGSCAKALVGVAGQRQAPWWRAPMQDQQSSTATRHEVHADVQLRQASCVADAGSSISVFHMSTAVQQQQQQQREPSSGAAPLQSLSVALSEKLQPVKLLFAGAMSAVVSRTAMAPLERVKMDQLLAVTPSNASVRQALLQVYQKEGIGGFWRGNALNLLRTAPFKALNYTMFDYYSRAFAGIEGINANLARFSAGAAAGITATLACFPLDVLRTRMMAPGSHNYGGPFSTLAGIVHHEGLGALYSGCVPAVVGMAPAGAVFYGVYDLLKTTHLKRMSAEQQHEQLQLPPLYTLLYGALAGGAAETIVFPLEVVRRRMQLQSMAAAAAAAATGSSGSAAVLRHHAGGAASAAGAMATSHMQQPALAWARIMGACAAISRTEGLRGFYAGLAPNMLQVLPSAALSYGTYEAIKMLLQVHAAQPR